MAATESPLRPIRVAHLAGQFDVGGLEKLLVEFARKADRDRFVLHFMALGPRGRLADDIEACGWPVTTLEQPPGVRPGQVLRLARLLRRWGADVVHTHNTKPLLYGAPAARLAGATGIVHTRHGQRFEAGRRQTVVFRLACRLVDRVVCVSDDGVSLSAREGVARGKLLTVYNGIDVARFAYAGPCPDGPAVMVGRLSPEKNVETLLRAAAIAAAQHPDFRLEIAGDGACRSGLEQLARELGISERVCFLGDVRDVSALLRRASLFVSSSLTEGISLTLLEAMAVGLPVIATRVGGNPEVVADGETGRLVPTRSPEKLAEAMLATRNDPETSRRMGLAGRHRVERMFTVQGMVTAYEKLYLECRGVMGRGPVRDERGSREGAAHDEPADLS